MYVYVYMYNKSKILKNFASTTLHSRTQTSKQLQGSLPMLLGQP